MDWQTIKVRFEDTVCFIQFNRPEANNAINAMLLKECDKALDLCEESISIIVLEGLPEVFCVGADFQGIHSQLSQGEKNNDDPEQLYQIWQKIASGPYIVISHVRGKANAGGIGFIAASDIVLASETAQFSLSELLFGLFPACVLPFLIRRIGFQKSHYLTLMTKPISAQQAHSCGLVDAFLDKSEVLLRQNLLRLKNLPKNGIIQYKQYMNSLNEILIKSKEMAVCANRAIFSDPQNLERIFQFVEKGKYPWEK